MKYPSVTPYFVLSMLAFTQVANANSVQNPGFEQGNSNWKTGWNAAITSDSNHVNSGSSAIKVGAGNNNGSAEQIITGLTPETSYQLRAFAKVHNSNSTIRIGVKNHGQNEIYQAVSSTNYQEVTVPFSTGASSTTATIYGFRVSGSDYGYADDFSVLADVDIEAPTVTISSNLTSPTNTTLIPITISFNEAVTDFTLSDLSINNGTANNFVANATDTQWTVDITANQIGTVEVSIAAGSVSDLAGNVNTNSNNFQIEHEAPNPTGENLVVNPSFEDGSTPWLTAWYASVISSQATDGSYAVRVGNGGNNGSAAQIITGLTANTEYTLSADIRVASAGSQLNLGVKDYGNTETYIATTNDNYERSSLNFITGASSTSARIYAFRSSGNSYGYADNFSLKIATPDNNCLAESISDGNTAYYIDADSGDDCNDGLSPETPWQSLDKINATTFTSGDQILLHDQSAWTGILSPKGSGSAGNHIVLSKYGMGDYDQRPIINGNGELHAVYLVNQEYFQISNLEVINSANAGQNKRGIEVLNMNAGVLHQIHIIDNYVHDINGDNTKGIKGSTGIMVSVHKGATPIQSYWDGIFIENNEVIRSTRTAIATTSAWWCRPSSGCYTGTGYVAHQNVEVRNNYVEDAGGDGVVASASYAPIVEYNMVNGANVNSGEANVGIWAWNSDQPLFQFNEAYNVQGTKDGQGFDVDYGQDGTIFQYNYSHDNVGGFILVATSPTGATTNAIIRYNISQNDHERVFELIGQADGIEIYNNTIYLPQGSTTKPFSVRDWGNTNKYPSNLAVYNNIFHLDGAGEWEGLSLVEGTTIFENNIVYGVHTAGEPEGMITSDPMLVAPGTATTGTRINGENIFGVFDGYKLQAGSPAIGAGTLISDAPDTDYWGNIISTNTAPNIGAYNGDGE